MRLRTIQNQMKKTELYGGSSQNGSMFSIATNSTNNVSICGSRSLSANQTDEHDDQFSIDSRCHDVMPKVSTGTHRSHRSGRHPKHSHRQRHKHGHHEHRSGSSSRNSGHKIQNTMILP